MKRGIVIYLENKRNLMLQFGCLYTSFKHIKCEDTDLIVFGTKDALEKVPEDCIKVECEAVSHRPEWHNYHYINSIYCLVGENSDFLDKYDLLLRSDVDTFITPAWNTFYPDMYTVGEGGYVNDKETADNLKRISGLFNLRHQGIHNIGSTHYGYAPLLRDICRLTLDVAKHILNNEFTNGEGQWPGWYKGVTLLYSSEIAVNHFADYFKKDIRLLDYGSTNPDSVNNHPHIHCWHTDNVFSKFWFECGKYDHMTKEGLNLDIVKDYCMYMALKSKEDMPWLG